MTAQELIDLCRDEYLDERGKSEHELQWSTATLLAYLNEAERRAANAALLLRDTTTTAVCKISLSAGTADYSLDSRIIKVNSARLKFSDGSDKPLRIVGVAALDASIPSWRWREGEPQGYAALGRSIRLDAMPDASIAADGYVALDVYRAPLEDMALSDEPEIHPSHHQDLLLYVAYRAFRKRDADGEQMQRAAGYLSIFNSIFGKYRSAGEVSHGMNNGPLLNLNAAFLGGL